ncbi:MAG TPA: transcription elongation factor GreA [Anaerolineales bacterium]|nr:transcription elongation factor GreA [Anaerolineales bacterium]
MANSYLTREGYNRLQDELEHLRTVRRQEVAERLHEALEGGDLGVDPDAEYEAAKNEQAFVEGRIKELEMLLSQARVVDAPKDSDTVTVGSKVTILEDGGEEEAYNIVGAAEADPRSGRISNESPLGKALMGKRVGDEVTVNAPQGSFSVNVLKLD